MHSFREARWVVGNVGFVGLHVVGSNNNLGRVPSGDAEYAERNAADLDWLHQSFALASAEGRRAMMIVIQANPGFELPAAQRTGFNDFLAALQRETIAFGRPVVLVHGDSHYFRIDKPMIGTRSGRRVESFTRVETFGELDNHWLHVTVHPNNPNVLCVRSTHRYRKSRSAVTLRPGDSLNDLLGVAAPQAIGVLVRRFGTLPRARAVQDAVLAAAMPWPLPASRQSHWQGNHGRPASSHRTQPGPTAHVSISAGVAGAESRRSRS